MRLALSQADHLIVAFIDGDMEIAPRMIKRLIPFIEDYDIVVGKKQIRGRLGRRILTFFSRLYIWSLFGLNFDTQTGVKLFKKHCIFPWRCDSFAYDIEILDMAKRAGYRIIEVPVEVEGSKPMKFSSVWKCFTESLNLWIRRWR
jgi:cellulose synthase/poly-beta-1,6-N-acetylglucosamine synthase-like glycosyltransferase